MIIPAHIEFNQTELHKTIHTGCTPTDRTIILPGYEVGNPDPRYFLKVLNPGYANLPLALQFLEQELHLFQALGNHPHYARLIVPELVDISYGLGTLPGIVVENVGVPLSEMWDFFDIPPSEEHFPYIAEKIIHAINHAQCQGYVLSDVKPGNIGALPDNEGTLHFRLFDLEGYYHFPLTLDDAPLFSAPYAPPELLYTRLAKLFQTTDPAQALKLFGEQFELPTELTRLSTIRTWTDNINRLLSRQTPCSCTQHSLAVLLYKLMVPETGDVFVDSEGVTSSTHLFPTQVLAQHPGVRKTLPVLRKAAHFYPDYRFPTNEAFLEALRSCF